MTYHKGTRSGQITSRWETLKICTLRFDVNRNEALREFCFSRPELVDSSLQKRNFEINKSSRVDMSLIIKKITSLNPKINLDKYDHVKSDLNMCHLSLKK